MSDNSEEYKDIQYIIILVTSNELIRERSTSSDQTKLSIFKTVRDQSTWDSPGYCIR